jgi:hypothetical protein
MMTLTELRQMLDTIEAPHGAGVLVLCGGDTFDLTSVTPEVDADGGTVWLVTN